MYVPVCQLKYSRMSRLPQAQRLSCTSWAPLTREGVWRRTQPRIRQRRSLRAMPFAMCHSLAPHPLLHRSTFEGVWGGTPLRLRQWWSHRAMPVARCRSLAPHPLLILSVYLAFSHLAVRQVQRLIACAPQVRLSHDLIKPVALGMSELTWIPVAMRVCSGQVGKRFLFDQIDCLLAR